MSNPKVKTSQKSDAFRQQETLQNKTAASFSEDQIRTRAYEIYESRDRNGNHADEDWSQAQSELLDLVGGK